jgi:hypothetical protein
MYWTTARILDRVDAAKEKIDRQEFIKARRRALWNRFLEGMPAILDKEPQNFSAYCARFKAAYELIANER